MPLTGEAKKQWQREYAAKRKAERDSAKKVLDDVVVAVGDQDANGKRYKSECRSQYDLARFFYGLSLNSEDDLEDAEAVKGKKKDDKKKKKVLVNPSTTPLAILGRVPTFQEWLDLRDKCRKDLYWFAKDILRKDLFPEVHQVICDQFVKKNFDGVYHEGYTIGDVHRAFDRQPREKVAMILDSRGNYKSTLNMIDAVQWMLNAPDCRIMVLTAEFKLSGKFKSQFKGYFHMPEGAKPTDFQLLFPEYILTGIEGKSQQNYYCPAAIHNNQGDPSLYGNSITANLAGWHFDIIKMDDAVSDKNSNEVETREFLIEKISLANALLDQWGFRDIIGTRYWGGTKCPDYYGYLINTIGPDNPVQYFCRGCWTLKSPYDQQYKDGELLLRDITEEMVTLTFPQKSTFKFLRKYLIENGDDNFRNQQLNEPIDPEETSNFAISFPEKDLWASQKDASWVPKEGDIYVAWDWAYTVGKSSDFSAGVAGKIFQREDGQWGIFVLEIRYGKWVAADLANQIVLFDRKWNPKRTLIEQTIAADLLKLEVARRAQMYGVSMNVYWKKPDQGSDAKRNRIKSLNVKFREGLIKFVPGNWLTETFSQFSRYTGDRKNRGRKDDIPDAVSFLAYFCPRQIRVKQP